MTAYKIFSAEVTAVVPVFVVWAFGILTAIYVAGFLGPRIARAATTAAARAAVLVVAIAAIIAIPVTTIVVVNLVPAAMVYQRLLTLVLAVAAETVMICGLIMPVAWRLQL